MSTFLSWMLMYILFMSCADDVCNANYILSKIHSLITHVLCRTNSSY